MKKAVAIILTAAVVLGLNACGVVVREADFRGNTTGLNAALNNLPKVEDTTEKIVMKPSAVPESERTDDAFIPENHFPEDDLIVCIEDVTDHGAKADGVTDDSDAVIRAINSAASKGGGCVYIPSGKYKITKNITVPAGVTLCGDWKSPEETPAGSEGTVILAYVPASYDRELFNMVSDAGLRNLTVFYPEMTADNAASYKPTVKHSNGDCMMLENITIVNSYDTIAIGRDGGSELHTLKNVYISCLGTGIFIDQVYDIGRLEGIYISPKYWQENVLKPLNDSEKKAVEDKIFETATGLQINRSDWEYTYNMHLEGLSRGIIVTQSEILAAQGTMATTNAQFSRIYINNCDTAINIEYTNHIGLSFTQTYVSADRECSSAVYGPQTFTGTVQFNDSKFSGKFKNPVLIEGQSLTTFANCDFDFETENYLASSVKGTVSFVQCKFTNEKLISLKDNISVGSLTSCKFEKEPKVEYIEDSFDRFFRNDTPLEAAYTSGRGHEYRENPPLPYTETLLSVLDFGAVEGDAAFDNTQAIQSALDKCGEYGGGVVYIPAGEYHVKGTLNVPEGVLLMGSLAVPSRRQAFTDNFGTILYSYNGKGDENAEAFISLETSAGIKGIEIDYPEQDFKTPYPWTIQSKGTDCYVIYVTSPNTYNFIDFGTYENDNHYIQYASGCPLRRGIFAGNNKRNGWIENCHFNPNYAYMYSLPAFGGNLDPMFSQQTEKLDSFILGYNECEHLLNNFVYAADKGIYFIEQNGKSSNGIITGHGTDSVRAGISASQLGVVEFVNFEAAPFRASVPVFVEMKSSVTGSLFLFNTMGWGGCKEGMKIEGGNLILQQFNFVTVQTVPILISGGNLDVSACYFPIRRNLMRILDGAGTIRFIGNTVINMNTTGTSDEAARLGISTANGEVEVYSNFKRG